jgi:hypothetical protein
VNSTIKPSTAGGTITVGNNGTVTFPQGSGANLTSGYAGTAGGSAGTVNVGTNSIVTLGTTAAGVPNDTGTTVTVTGDFTGATSSGAYTYTTINNALDNKTKIAYGFTGNDGGVNLVDVSSATSLANALDLAASNMYTGLTVTDSYHYFAGFTYGGNTYLLEHTASGIAPITAMTTSDILVKLTGITDIHSLQIASNNITL